MNDYTKGILTGASLILCFFMFVSAKSQEKNLGDITVRSISVLNDKGEESIWMGFSRAGEGFLTIFNGDGKQAVYLGAAKTGIGSLIISNADEELAVAIGSDEDGVGNLGIADGDGNMRSSLSGRGVLRTYNAYGRKTAFLSNHLVTFNKNEVQTGYFGTNVNEDGMAVLFDRYGDEGWAETGKK